MRRRMTKRNSLAFIVAAAFLLACSSAVWAGGGSFGNDEDQADDNGPSFIGFVKDTKGDGVDDAKVTVTVKVRNSSMIVHADTQGMFLVRGFDKALKPDEIEIGCSKDGYAEVSATRRPALDANSPIEVDCVLKRQ